MTKFIRFSGILSMLMIGIVSIIGYFFLANRGNTEVKHAMLSLVFITFIGICIFGIFAGVKKAKSVYDKVLTALIGNILLNILFIVALYFIVITFIK